MVETITRFLTVAKDLTLAIAIVLFLAVVLIVGNTIQDILNKRSEILIMKLVGATDGFIQRPFLYTGFWFGASVAVCMALCRCVAVVNTTQLG